METLKATYSMTHTHGGEVSESVKLISGDRHRRVATFAESEVLD